MDPERITRLPSREPATSIVVLAYNQLPYTSQCLDSIRRYTTSPYELIAVDNGSTDGTHEYLIECQEAWRQGRGEDTPEGRYCHGFKIVRHASNLGYAAGNNAGLACSDYPYVAIVNNDVVVTEGWLEELLRCARLGAAIGIVGPMTNYASGPQVIQQVPYDTSNLQGLERFAELWSGQHRGEYVKFWRVVGFCMLIDRRVIDTIGGFDPRYGLGNFDDDDYCLRSAIAGFESAIARGCYVHHFGSRTFTEEGVDYRHQIRVNWEIYKAKWGLPQELPYGAIHSLYNVMSQPFDPTRHRVALESSARAA
jgi:GT2 family glycosyltransferase